MENLRFPIPDAWGSWISTRWNELLQRARTLFNSGIEDSSLSQPDLAKNPESVKAVMADTGKMITSLRSHAHKTIRQFRGPIDILTYSDIATITTREIIARINSNEFTTPDQAIAAFNTTVQAMLANYSKPEKN